MCCAVESDRQTDEQKGGLPFVDQCGDGGEALGIGLAVNRRQRVRLPELPLANS